MSEASARAKWLFWGMAAASLLLAVIPSLVLIDKAREFHRFLTGWQPDTLRQLTIRRVPRHDAEDEKQAPRLAFIEFSLRAPKARKVRLGGGFNRWSFDLPMTRKEGIWRVVVPLPPGRHSYAFEVDGTWTPDPKAREKDLFNGKESSVQHVH